MAPVAPPGDGDVGRKLLLVSIGGAGDEKDTLGGLGDGGPIEAGGPKLSGSGGDGGPPDPPWGLTDCILGGPIAGGKGIDGGPLGGPTKLGGPIIPGGLG